MTLRNAAPIAAALLTVAAPALAQQTPSDVPPGHWAYEAVESLLKKGIVQGYPGGVFQGERTLTRYEMAALLKRILDRLPASPAPAGAPTTPTPAPAPPAPAAPALTESEKDALRRLTAEFLPELAVIGADLKEIRQKLGVLDQQVIDLQQELKDAREVNLDQQKDIDLLKKIHFNGYLQLRFDALFAHNSLFKGAGSGGSGQRPTLGAPHIGGPSNGFLVRRGRFKVEGPLNPNDAFTFQLDFGSVGGVNLRDAWADIKSSLPRNTTFRIGQFPPPFTYVLVASSRVRETPDRPLGFSDTSNSAFVHKDTVSSLGGEVTAGSIVPLLSNQDRDIGFQFTYKGSRATTQFGWFNGEGRDVAGQRPLNSALTFMGRVEQRFPLSVGNAFVGLSRYDGKYSVRGAAPTGSTPASFRYADRAFTNVDTRWEGKDGWQVRYEHLWGTFETTPDRALFLPGNRVESWYATVRKDISPKTALSATYDVFRPTSKTVAGVGASDYARKTLQGGVLHWVGPRTRLRLWYVQALTPYDPSAAAGSRSRAKVGQFIGEIQIEY